MIGYVDNWSRYEIPPFTATQNYQIGGFVQDNWRVTGKLTLNLGFRYDVETPRTERFNQMTYFNPAAASPITVPGLNLHGAVEFAGVNGNPRTEFNTYWGEVGPRFGFAYNVLQAHNSSRWVWHLLRSIGRWRRGQRRHRRVPRERSGHARESTTFPASPWLPLEFLRNPFPFGIQPRPAAARGRPPCWVRR